MNAQKHMVTPDGHIPDDRVSGDHGSGEATSGDLRSGDHDDSAQPMDDVVETDLVPGGWEAWEVTPPVPRKRRRVAHHVDDLQPAQMLSRAAAQMLATWRLDRGMRQHEAAAALGVQQAWISRLERCRASVSIELLARIAGVTGSSVSLRLAPPSARRPVRRSVTGGRAGRARLELTVDGPEARSAAPDRRPA